MVRSREQVVQNLKDAGCSRGTIEEFIRCYDRKQKEEQILLLQRHRDQLLRQVHREEKRISCLDYLIYQINTEQV